MRRSHRPISLNQAYSSRQPSQGLSRLRLVRDTFGAALIMGGFVVVFANLMPVRPQGDVKGGPVAIYRIKAGKGTDYAVINPPESLVKSA